MKFERGVYTVVESDDQAVVCAILEPQNCKPASPFNVRFHTISDSAGMLCYLCFYKWKLALCTSSSAVGKSLWQTTRDC